MKSNKKHCVALKRVFGLVSSEKDGRLVLARSGHALAPVLESLQADVPQDDLYIYFKGIKSEEIAAARAYLVRFGADVNNPATLPEGRKALLVDENISYTFLPYIQETFGPASHVEAEGLSRQNLADRYRVHRKSLDSLICRFAVAHQFAGLLTCDTDFAALYKNPQHDVRGIHVFLIPPDAAGRDVSKHIQSFAGVIQDRLLESPKLTVLGYN